MIRLIYILLIITSLKAEDFITQVEYAKMLYSNPRGIGCDLCHGEKGEGKVLATYKEKDVEKKLKAPSLSSLSLEEFRKGISKQSLVMPSYFLTKKESESLYIYLQSFTDTKAKD